VTLLRRHPVLSVTGFVLLVVAAVIAASGVLVWQEAHHDDASDVESADAIVVLGAAQYDGVPSPVFKGRLDHAALLFDQDRAPYVIVLGANQPGDRTTEAASGRDYLIEQGVPAEAVIAVPVGHTSFESLEAAAETMGDRDLTTAFLVSDPWHNARIERMASDLGITGYASATWTSAAKTEEARLPGYVRETFAYLAYRVLGH
jgi:vancomycin permeability regulator SanA